MQIETRINRGLTSTWKAESYVHLTPTTGLRITTSKNHAGKLVTTAQHVRFDDGVETFMLFADFHKFIIVKDVRVTENAVKAQHDAALLLIDSIVNECEEFYRNKKDAT